MASYSSDSSTPPSSPQWKVDSFSETNDQRRLCKICLKQWDSKNARKLACMHVFHEECLNSQATIKSTTFVCPVCSTRVAWPKTGASSLIKHDDNSCCINYSDSFIDEPSPKFRCSLNDRKVVDMVCITCNYEPICSGCISKHSGKGHHSIAMEEKFNYIHNFQHECMETIEKLDSLIDEEKTILHSEIDVCIENAKEKLLQQKEQFIQQLNDVYDKKITECRNIALIHECDTLSITPSIERSIQDKLEQMSIQVNNSLCTFEKFPIKQCASIKTVPEGSTTQKTATLGRNKKLSFYFQRFEVFDDDYVTKVKELFVDRSRIYLLSESVIGGATIHKVVAFDHALKESHTIISREGELRGFTSDGKWNYLIDVEDESIIRCKTTELGSEIFFKSFFRAEGAKSLVFYSQDNLIIIIRKNSVLCLKQSGEVSQVNIDIDGANMTYGIFCPLKSEIFIIDSGPSNCLRVFDPIRKSFLQSYTPINPLSTYCIGIYKQFLLAPTGRSMLSIDLLRRDEIRVPELLREESQYIFVYGNKVFLLSNAPNGFKIQTYLIRVE
ncbi:DgyrCDS9716 [Dimorphilus gyrociliatus]|uniref:DgyrCDS9716 n=1 Tax=Dimorphilus gyrociliatus TaxID=2664684 RepID=A0A7I8VZZ6_9ANNE|nr:DgyrCDS9716 [Dimorphilus gyrociliatus]